MIEKQLITTRGSYTAPECISLELRAQGIICQSPGAWDNSILDGTNWGDDDVDLGLS